MATQGSTVIYKPVGPGVNEVAFIDRDNGDGTFNLRALFNPSVPIHNAVEDVTLSAHNTFKVVVAAV